MNDSGDRLYVAANRLPAVLLTQDDIEDGCRWGHVRTRWQTYRLLMQDDRFAPLVPYFVLINDEHACA